MKREYLTVGETAKLLNISPHTIRYYDKIKLIDKKIHKESGYRIFDYEDVYRLSGIVALRESGIGIDEIKKLSENHSKDNFKRTVEVSRDKVRREIDRLKKLQNRLDGIMSFMEDTDLDEPSFNIEELEESSYSKIISMTYDEEISIKGIYEAYMKKGIDHTDINLQSLDYLLREDDMILCNKCWNRTKGEVHFLKGRYLVYTFMVDDDNEIFQRIDEYLLKASSVGYHLQGEILLSMESQGAFIQGNAYVAKLICKIQ